MAEIYGRITKVEAGYVEIDNVADFWSGKVSVPRKGMKVTPKIGERLWVDWAVGGKIKSMKINGKKQF